MNIEFLSFIVVGVIVVLVYILYRQERGAKKRLSSTDNPKLGSTEFIDWLDGKQLSSTDNPEDVSTEFIDWLNEEK